MRDPEFGSDGQLEDTTPAAPPAPKPPEAPAAEYKPEAPETQDPSAQGSG